MDLFGFKKRKAQREAKRLETEKLSALKIKKIKEEYKVLKERAEKAAERSNESSKTWASWINDKCPKCGSTKVNDRIQRLQGEFEGSLEGSMSGGLLYRSGYVSGHNSGKIDTNPVNKCECGHEWKKRETEYSYSRKELENYFEKLKWVLEEYYKAFNAELDPKDLDENYETKEDKRKALTEVCDKSARVELLLEFFKEIHLETIKETAEKEVWGDSWDNRHLKDFYEFWDEKLLEEKLKIKSLPNLIGYVQN
jgi:hypothetical protein